MTCEDCIHHDLCVCVGTRKLYPGNSEGCRFLLTKNRFVELPCKIGQIVYEVVYLRNGTFSHINPLKVVGIHIGNFPDLRGHKRKSYLVVVYPTSEILGRIPLDKVGKNIFLTKEETEAAIDKRKDETK